MSAIPPNRNPTNELNSPFAKKPRPHDRPDPNANYELIPVAPQHRVRCFLFTQRHPSEVILEVAHNILQKEDPFTNQLEEIKRRIDTAPFFTEPLMAPRTVQDVDNNIGSYDFHVINLVLANHFEIPFNPMLHHQEVDGLQVLPSNFPFYVVSTTCSYERNPTATQKICHFFCVRSFVSNNGNRTWVVLDSLYAPPAPRQPNILKPFSITDLPLFFFGTTHNQSRRRINVHLRKFFPWVATERDDIKVIGFFRGEMDKLDGPTGLPPDALSDMDDHFDYNHRVMHRVDRKHHNRNSGSVSVHFLDNLSIWN